MKRKGVYDPVAIGLQFTLLQGKGCLAFAGKQSVVASCFLLLASCLLSLTTFSQILTQGTLAINAQLHYGYIVPHRPSMIGLVTGHTVGLEIDFIKTHDGSKTFERVYHCPETGLSYCFFDLGNQKVLGKAQALYLFSDFPLAQKNSFQFNLRLGGGIGYIQKPFDRFENFKNNAIGSHVNGVMSLRAEIQQKISSRSKLAFQWGITHWSNGSAVVPNLGINVTTMGLTYQHFFGEQKKINHDSLPPINKKIRTSFYAAAFRKEIIPAGGRKYFVAIIYGNVSKVLNHKSSLGAGIDLFYNKAIIESLNRQDKNPKAIDGWRGGVHLGYMLTMNRFDIVIENGVYVFGKLDGDTFLYTRLGTRQKITKHIFLCANLKTHFAKADYFELGVGYEW